MPSRRHSLQGVDHDGLKVLLVASISKELYRCPGCGRGIAVGTDHVIVEFPGEGRNTFHQHWHTACARDGIVRQLRSVHPVPASNPGKPTRGQRRAATLKRRRDR